MDPFQMVVVIVSLGTATGTIHKYLDVRMSLAKRQVSEGDKNTLREVQALREEIAALKRHESEAILSFDSTLQTLDARVKHLERQALGEGTGKQILPGAATGAAIEKPASVTVQR
jgi:hypothetical protein